MRVVPGCVMAGLLAVLTAGPIRAEADASLFAAIEVALARKSGPDVLAHLAQRLAGELPQDLALAVSARPTVPAPEAAPVARNGDMQAALTQLAILSGTNGHLTLQLAQTGRRDVIDLLSGQARLADLAADPTLLTRAGPDDQGSVWHLNRPLVIWPGATLVIAPGEVLEMDTTQGAFILSFGSVRISGATLRGTLGRNAAVPAFRPFLLVTGQGTLDADDARFHRLGFRGPVAFRGVSVLSGGVMRPETPARIANSRFSDIHSLSLEGTDGAVVANNRFDASLSTALSVSGGAGIVLAGNRIAGTAEGAGVRLSGSLKDISLVANVVANGGRNGIQIDGESHGLTLAGNTVTGNLGAGITVSRGLCLTLRANIIAANGTTGLRLSDSGAATVSANAVFANGSAGIEVLAQSGLPPIELAGNVLHHNREGLRAADLAELQFSANDLARQTPRQFSGDLAPWLGAYLTAGQAGEAFVIPATLGGATRPAAPCEME
jgi:Right handed beta helix region